MSLETPPNEPPRRSRRTALWIGLLGVVALAAGLGVAFVHLMPRPVERAAAPDARRVPLGDDPGEEVIGEALSRAPVDSTAIKNRWVEEIPGADLADLPAERREVFVRFANAERCTCGCGFTLAACRALDPTCEVSLPRVTSLLDSVRRGQIHLVAGLRERPRAAR